MVRLVVTLVAVVALAACTDRFGAGNGGYECGGLTFTADQLDEAPPAAQLRPDTRAAFDGQGHEIPEIDLADGWRILEQSSDTVGLLRPLEDPQEIGPGDVRTHEHVRAHRSRGATNVPDGDWVLDSAGVCTPRLDLGGLGHADLTLAAAPDPAATELELDIYERACASGEPADGRVEVVEQAVTDEEVRLVVGVQPPPGGPQNCPSNPPTHVTIELDEPLGDRTIVDASTLPSQPVPIAPGAAGEG